MKSNTPATTPDNTPDLEALAHLGVQHSEKLGDIHSAGEASVVAQEKTTEAVKGLEPALEAIVLHTQPKDVQKVQIELGNENEVAKVFWEMLRGRTGENGKDGHSPTEEELVNLILPLIPDPIPGKDAVPPTDEQLLALIRPLIPEAIPGHDGHTPTAEELLVLIRPLIPDPLPPIEGKPGTPGKDGSPDTGKRIVEKISSLEEDDRLSYEALKDRPNFETFKGRGAGGQALAVQRSNVLLSSDVKILDFIGAGVSTADLGGGVIAITIVGGGSTPVTESPTGAIDGVNKAYAVTQNIGTILTFAIAGQFIHPADYVALNKTITFSTALDASLSGFAFTIVYIPA